MDGTVVTIRPVVPARLARLRLAALCAAALLLGGCTSVRDYLGNGLKVGPRYGRPAAPVEQDWIDVHDQHLGGDSRELSRWWSVFNDPVLDALVADSARQNLTLREAGFRVLQARAARNITVGGFFPQTQSFGGDYTRATLSKARANTSFLPTRTFDQWDTGFNLAWELDFWGRYRRAIEAADADLDASVEGYDAVLVTLLGDVAQSYVELRTAQRQLALAQANVELQHETLTLADARFRGGQSSELDRDQAQSNLSQTEALVPLYESHARQAANQLCILMGLAPFELEARLGPAPIPQPPAQVALGMPAQLLGRRPDIRAAERRAAAQCARIGVAQSELYPHIALTGTVGYASQNLNQLLTGRAFAGTVGPSFQWNVLNYGRLRNNVRLQDARFQELVTTYQQAVLSAQGEVENGIIEYIKAHDRVAALAEGVAATQRAVQLSLVQYKGGITDFNRVALLQQNLVTQQDRLALAQGEMAGALIKVYRALGGGWEIRMQ